MENKILYIGKKYSNFEKKFIVSYIHKKLDNLLKEYLEVNGLNEQKIIKLEDGIFAKCDNSIIVGIVPIDSDSIYSNIFGSFEIKDFTNNLTHFIHELL
jgi:hypothetical protein